MTEPEHLKEAAPKIGLLNLMPYTALDKTTKFWSELLGDVVNIKFDDDPREFTDCRSSTVISDWIRFSDAADELDALVVTGANLELENPGQPAGSGLLDYDEIAYIKQLRGVIDWSSESKRATIYSCLASHIALSHLFGLERQRGPKKVFGVYDHQIEDIDNRLIRGLGKAISSPQSRWGNISADRLEEVDVDVLANSREVGWLIAQSENMVFIQGHPEYGANDLRDEFQRDQRCGQTVPENYFVNNDPSAGINFGWSTDRKVLFGNLRDFIDERSLGSVALAAGSLQDV